MSTAVAEFGVIVYRNCLSGNTDKLRRCDSFTLVRRPAREASMSDFFGGWHSVYLCKFSMVDQGYTNNRIKTELLMDRVNLQFPCPFLHQCRNIPGLMWLVYWTLRP